MGPHLGQGQSQQTMALEKKKTKFHNRPLYLTDTPKTQVIRQPKGSFDYLVHASVPYVNLLSN